MRSEKIFHALYNDDDILLSAVKKIKDNHYDIEEIYTPLFLQQWKEAVQKLEDSILKNYDLEEKHNDSGNDCNTLWRLIQEQSKNKRYYSYKHVYVLFVFWL